MNPQTRYARNEDGQYIAYQTFGEGAVDLIFISDWCSNLEIMWEDPTLARFLQRLASFSRVKHAIRERLLGKQERWWDQRRTNILRPAFRLQYPWTLPIHGAIALTWGHQLRLRQTILMTRLIRVRFL